tara:strand:- start:216 stop:386 length:171 start_codon:yes stop_codon:yes gene_type:complete
MKNVSILESQLNKKIEDLKKLIKNVDETTHKNVSSFYKGKLAAHESDLWEINQLKK